MIFGVDMPRCHVTSLWAGSAPSPIVLVIGQDLQQSGAPLAKICQAGPWRSGAMFRYLDECDLEDNVALEAAIHEEDEVWID